MSHRTAPVATTPVARPVGLLVPVAVAAALLVALSVIRPWGDSGGGAPPRAPGSLVPAAADGPSASPVRSPGPDQVECGPAGWRLVSLDRLADRTVRTWTPVTPVRASGPLDVTINELVLDSPAVLGLGVCAPALTAADPSATAAPQAGIAMRLVTAWQRVDEGVRTVGVWSVGTPDDDPAIALLYRPTTSTQLSGAWPSGHYVLELAPDDGLDRGTPSGVDDGKATTRGWFVGLYVPARG